MGDNGKGSFAKIPKETLIDNGKKTGPANGKNFPSHIRSSNGRATGTANLANVSKETLSDNGKVNMANMPKETLVANGKANAKSVNSQRWRCLVTGHISNPGGLSTYQRARGINTSLRVRISN